MDIKEIVKEYLEKARLMQVATAKNNQPWVCSVYFAYDDSFNLYWLSTPQRRHSKEIAENEKVAGTIVLPHTPGDKVRGLQFEGFAQQVKEEKLEAMDAYATRMGMKDERRKNILEGTDGHELYRIIPTRFVLFDEVNFPHSPRQELVL